MVDQTICYTYDGDGDRVATTNCNVVNGGGGNTTGIISEFLYDIDHRLASQINISTEKLTRANIYAGGEYLAEDAPDAAEAGTPVATQMRITDQVGSLRGRWDYAGKQNGGCTSFPYGDGFSCTNPSTALFTGKDRDNESALDYFGARYYSNRMGRFSSPDPSQLYYADAMNPQSLNLYSYALNNPLTNTDPTGLYCAWEDGTSDDDPSDGGDSERDCNSQGGHWTDQSNPCHGADGCVTTFDWNQLQTQDAPITTMIAPNSGCQTGFNIGVTAGVDGAVGVVAGGAATGGGAAGVTFGGGHPNVYASATGGAAVRNKGAPAQTNGPSIVFGGGAGASAGVTFGNATQASQMKGSALTFGGGVDVGVGGGVQVSVGTDAAGNTIWQVSILGGVGLKVYGYALTTKTAAAGTGTPCGKT